VTQLHMHVRQSNHERPRDPFPLATRVRHRATLEVGFSRLLLLAPLGCYRCTVHDVAVSFCLLPLLCDLAMVT
jgi:hypothetical protein